MMLSEVKQLQKNSDFTVFHTRFHLCEESRIVKYIDIESKMMVARGWGRGNGE